MSERLAVVILAGIDEFTTRARLTCRGRGGDETRRTAGREGISRLHFFLLIPFNSLLERESRASMGKAAKKDGGDPEDMRGAKR